MENDAFVQLFSLNGKYYLYDVNTDKIIKVPFSVYEYLGHVEGFKDPEVSIDTLEYIRNLKAQGLLKSEHVEETKHDMSDIMVDCLQNKISHVILQVTQNCNLRCSYCVYSGEYKHRSHTQKKMSFETAKKAIDFLFAHSRDAKNVTIGFYGGEPLLQMELIRQCVEYADKAGEGREVRYAITTNGTLLDKEIIDYFFTHKFAITFSLDGPDYIHNKSRQFAGSQKGSFDALIKNVWMIKELYPEYYKSYVIFNAVLDTSNGFNCVDHFIVSNEAFEDIMYSSSLIDMRYTDRTPNADNDFFAEREYEQFKLFLKRLGRLQNTKVSRLLETYIHHIDRIRAGKHNSVITHLPKTGHRGGPCVPGFLRLFVNAEGNLFPCERVSEISEVTRIGHISTGIDLEKAYRILNIESISSDKCRNCWAYRYCTTCVADFDGINDFTTANQDQKCQNVKFSVMQSFMDYCALKELGYDFELDGISRKIAF